MTPVHTAVNPTLWARAEPIVSHFVTLETGRSAIDFDDKIMNFEQGWKKNEAPQQRGLVVLGKMQMQK